VSANGCSTVLRSFTGPEAVELAILCRPDGESHDVGGEATVAYRALAEALAVHRASFANVVGEALFLRDARRVLPPVLAARARVLADLGAAGSAPLPSFVEQAPVDRRAAFELLAWVVVPNDASAWSVRDVRPEPSCTCAGCTRSGARLVQLGDQVSLHTASLYGAGGDAYEQAWAMLHAAARLLARCGLDFRDVVRTWIHLRDIDRDYDALNAARREFFQQCGIERRPASTGVEGGPFPAEHVCALRLDAVKRSPRRDVTTMSTPYLNEAWSYGADFSRGLKVVEANKITLHVSGTASIDEAGRTVHAGDFEAQAERMLDNIESLLGSQGAGFASLVSGVAYLKRAEDAAALRAAFARRGFDGFPCAVVEAALCRPDLLCETEAVAMLPPTAAGA
jgi:enamine deaminase RidA (YjgF/YER057c/UK114 family)